LEARGALGPWGRLPPPSLLLLLLAACAACASEITFELPDNAKQCFYEEIAQGTKCTLEFQFFLLTFFSVSRFLVPACSFLVFHKLSSVQYFSPPVLNRLSLEMARQKPIILTFIGGFNSEQNIRSFVKKKSACVSIHEALKSVIDYQTHFRLREAQGRSRAEDLNTRVAYWSIGEAIILLVVSIGQVFLLKSFFSDKRTTTTCVGS
ncbi:TMED7 protein, partial [Nothocercus nigrocapillus]|nr:TMED7 protein [Nothocercus nigrocapillus]